MESIKGGILLNADRANDGLDPAEWGKAHTAAEQHVALVSMGAACGPESTRQDCFFRGRT